MLELQDIGSRQPSMESLTGEPDGTHLHPGHQYSNQRSPSLRFLSILIEFTFTQISHILIWWILIGWLYFVYRRSRSPLVRTPSPRRRNHLHPHHDVGFSDTVSNVVEIVKEERGHQRGYRPNGRFPRGMRCIRICCTNFGHFQPKKTLFFGFLFVLITQTIISNRFSFTLNVQFVHFVCMNSSACVST